MSWITQLVNVLNVFKQTPSTESPISTVSTILAEPVVGSTTSDSTPGGPMPSQEAGNQALRHKWRRLARRFPNSSINKSDRWGLLSQLYSKNCACRCLACRAQFSTWQEGRAHECNQEKGFRQITQRHSPSSSDSRS